ncbi:hypothetical protein [Rhizobium sp. NLR22b]|uniref:hypothetical protein n=1 Tax=Rhizobium sp. NLR22b TaxID=2731115 RepID=UPI001C834BF6|nr:hypothetical protein [Rhizobium sp. NLR22b]MBX5238603.1 hypothetical protein [Rhizobium sp. NLR22b]
MAFTKYPDMPEPIKFDEAAIKKMIEEAIGKWIDIPINKYIGLDPPRQKEVMDSVVANLQELQSQIPDSSEVLNSAVQGVTDA